MKPIFGTNKGAKNDTDDNSALFLAETVSDELMDELDRVSDEVYEEYKKKDVKRPRVKAKTKSRMIAVGVAALGLVLSRAFDISPENTKLFAAAYFGVIIVVTLLFICIKNKFCSKKEEESDDATSFFDDYLNDPRIEAVSEKMIASLGANESATSVDVLYFDYSYGKGSSEPVVKQRGKRAYFINIEYKMYKTDKALCLVCDDCRYEFELSAMRRLRTVKCDSKIFRWNKKVPFDEGEYRLHGLEKSSSDDILFDRYAILELEKDGEIYGLYFPCYEINALKAFVEDIVEISIS